MWHTLLQAQSGVTIQAMWCIGVQQLYVTHMFSSTSQLQVRLTNAACSYDVTECPVAASLLGTRNYISVLGNWTGLMGCPGVMIGLFAEKAYCTLDAATPS